MNTTTLQNEAALSPATEAASRVLPLGLEEAIAPLLPALSAGDTELLRWLGLDKPRSVPAEARTRGPRAADVMPTYSDALTRVPALTAEDELRLARLYSRTKDRRVAARLVSAHLRLVIKIAREYRAAGADPMDLIQEGNLGLLHAVDKFDPERGVKLSTYAAWWIRAYVLKSILDGARIVRLGTTNTQRRIFFRLERERQKLIAQGIDPTVELLGQRLSADPAEVREMQRRMAAPDQSLEAPLTGSDGEGSSRHDLLADEHAVGADTQVENAELHERVQGALSAFRKGLGERDRAILDERVMAEDPATLTELAERFGLSRERVRQLEARVLKKLHAHVREELGESDLAA